MNRKTLLDFFIKLFRGRPELPTELLEFQTKNSANFCNVQNAITFRFMVFWKLYFRRTLELYLTQRVVQEQFEF